MSWNREGAPEPLDGEVVVWVLTPLGQTTGSFVWLRRDLWLLKLINGSLFGCHFAWNEGTNGYLQPNQASPKLPGIDKLKPE